MVQPLVILVVIISNELSIVNVNDANTSSVQTFPDPRGLVLTGIINELRDRSHQVIVRGALKRPSTYDLVKSFGKDNFHDHYGMYMKEDAPDIDILITWWAFDYKTRILHRTSNTAILHYEHGFTHGDVSIDPGGLLGSSYYFHRLNEFAQDDYDDDACIAFMQQKMSSGSWSKRPQDDNIIDIPTHIIGKFIFLPSQHIGDLSIEKFSNITMFELMDTVVDFCRKHDSMPLVIKIHPHVEDSEVQTIKEYIDTLRQAQQHISKVKIYISKASIGFLTKNAKVTITLNGGTIMDNMYTQTPVVVTAQSLFSNTDAVIYNQSPQHGLRSALKKAWSEKRKLRQRQIACWVAKMSLNIAKTPKENVAVIQRHLNYAKTGYDLSNATTSILPPSSRSSKKKFLSPSRNDSAVNLSSDLTNEFPP